MAGNASTYLQAARQNWYKGTTYPAAPTNVYVALFTAMPTQAGAGGTEVSGTGYARQAISAASGWGAISGGTTGPWSIANAGTTNFGNAGSAWGTVLGFGIYDASTSGNLLYVANFGSSVIISNGAPVSFAAGAITITVSNVSQYLANAALNWYKGTAYPTAPTNTYVALYTTMPNAADSGGVEVSGTGYARQPISASSGWSALTGTDPTDITNANIITYGAAGSAWGTCLGWCLRDALTAGNLLDLFTLVSSQAINNGATASFAVGALSRNMD